MRPQPIYDDPNYRAAGTLEGKAAIITGGDSGIGRAVAIAFAKEGADVALVYLNEHRDAEETKRAVERYGRRCFAMAGDVGDEGFCRSVVERAVREFAHLDILVNNAAERHVRKGLEEISAEQPETTVRINLFGCFFMVKAAIPHLKPGAAIITTTSVQAFQPSASLLDYAATKGAILTFTRGLSDQLVSKGVRVNAVAPGPVWTPLIVSSFPPEHTAEFGQDTPMKHAAQPAEIAPSYVFLACSDSGYMSGAVLPLTGGEVVVQVPRVVRPFRQGMGDAPGNRRPMQIPDAPNGRWDAVVVGAGPNGLAAAIALAREGRSVLVMEGENEIGGGARTAEITVPGFQHDICSAVHPLGAGSPFFRTLPLADHGLQWIDPPAAVAHPFDDGSAAVLYRSVEATAESMGQDRDDYCRLMTPLARAWPDIEGNVLGPLRFPRHPLAMARFGLLALRSATGLARHRFRTAAAQALVAGLAAHGVMPLTSPASAAFALVLGVLGHTVGWPIPRAGAGSVSAALASYLRSQGGQIVTDARVAHLDELPPARAILCDLTPRQLLQMAGDRLPGGYRRTLGRFQYGPGVFKVDWALNGPIPWRARGCTQAATVHIGGTFDEIAAGELAVWRGHTADRPFVILTQPSLFDSMRAPAGMHTAWGYCHVPNGSTEDMAERIEAQVARFAFGFRERIIARRTWSPADLAAHNPNLVGGDIGGGANTLRQLLARPILCLDPYATPLPNLFMCSASTPPGGGVHGLCGYYAAGSAEKLLRRDDARHQWG